MSHETDPPGHLCHILCFLPAYPRVTSHIKYNAYRLFDYMVMSNLHFIGLPVRPLAKERLFRMSKQRKRLATSTKCRKNCSIRNNRYTMSRHPQRHTVLCGTLSTGKRSEILTINEIVCLVSDFATIKSVCFVLTKTFSKIKVFVVPNRYFIWFTSLYYKVLRFLRISLEASKLL